MLAIPEVAVQWLSFVFRITWTSKQYKRKMPFRVIVSSLKPSNLGKHFLPAHLTKLCNNFTLCLIGDSVCDYFDSRYSNSIPGEGRQMLNLYA